MSAGGEASVIITGYWLSLLVSLNFLLKRWLAQTAEAVVVHGSVVEDEKYLNPQNYLTNARLPQNSVETSILNMCT